MKATESVDNKVMVFALPVSGSEFMQNIYIEIFDTSKKIVFWSRRYCLLALFCICQGFFQSSNRSYPPISDFARLVSEQI